jgi:hypothetical protein
VLVHYAVLLDVLLAQAARDADVAMFYYSGHAVQFASFN